MDSCFAMAALPDLEGPQRMANSLALFSTTFLWFLYHIFPGQLDRRGCVTFSLFSGSFTLRNGLRSNLVRGLWLTVPVNTGAGQAVLGKQ